MQESMGPEEPLVGFTSASRCPICLDDLDNDAKTVRLFCNHLFHGQCVAEALHIDPRCPVCRRRPENAQPFVRVPPPIVLVRSSSSHPSRAPNPNIVRDVQTQTAENLPRQTTQAEEEEQPETSLNLNEIGLPDLRAISFALIRRLQRIEMMMLLRERLEEHQM